MKSGPSEDVYTKNCRFCNQCQTVRQFSYLETEFEEIHIKVENKVEGGLGGDFHEVWTIGGCSHSKLQILQSVSNSQTVFIPGN